MEQGYLIKRQDKTLCYFGMGYVVYIYDDQTWVSTGPRKRAKVFTRAEAVEFSSKWNGYKMVKV